ncbi:DJ-1/PfpI family protein [Pseudonocardia sp. TRM90224]|uniref:DJ-1/PfpI family protein n=1 Tax=Pseudonocardia sp. TRM90224 TaxID=2812678 RepID=UPI001E583B9E|nr:DJ-1/PfpI family protein [Pseudonocardia sp. TRM90224]
MTGTRIDIAVFDGFDELDVVGPWEVLRTAATLGAPLHVRLAGIPGAAPARGLLGLEIGVDGDLDPAADVLVVPGTGCPPPPVLGARAELAALVGVAARRGSVVASVCTGAFVLAAAGLLRDRPATTHWDVLRVLGERGVETVDARVVDTGPVITSGGVTSGLDLGLHLVKRFAGEELAYLTACRLEYEAASA